MRKIFFTAAALTLALSAAAHAERSPHGAPTIPAQGTTFVASPETQNVGGQREPVFGPGYVTTLTAGGVLPTNGSNGAVQTANSLPSPAEIGGAWISPEAYAAARGYEQDNGHAYAASSFGVPQS